MAEKEHSFWGRHVEQPVTVLLARPDLKVNVLGEIIHSGAAGSAASGKRGAAAGTGPLALLDDVEERPKKAPKRRGGQREFLSERYDNRDEHGLFTTNRRGEELCMKFQDGRCTETVTRGSNKCSQAPHRVHQCAKCLAIGHGAETCDGGKVTRRGARPREKAAGMGVSVD